MKTELHVVVRPHPLRGVDHTPLEGSVDVSGRRQDRRGTRLGDDLASEIGAHAYSESLEVANRRDLLPEPARHLRCEGRALARDEVVRGVGLLPELEPIALVVPRHHPLGVHPERYGAEPSIAGSFSNQYTGAAMNASIVPFDAASKHSNACTIWPLAKTSMRSRPLVVSSTTFASRWAAP